MSTVKVFFFPYAGGSATMFNKWKSYLGKNSVIEIVPVELAGRGRRITEPLYSGLQDAVTDLYRIVNDEIKKTPYAFFGHSLGGLLAYELAQKIKCTDIQQPSHLFFSGRSAPHVKRHNKKNYHLMGNEEFKLKVKELGGTPPEFFDHDELVDFFLPLLKNDFRLSETYLTNQDVFPFDCDISVLIGKQDCEVSDDQVSGWKIYTNGNCTFNYFDGGHFFLHDEGPAIIELITKKLIKTSL